MTTNKLIRYWIQKSITMTTMSELFKNVPTNLLILSELKRGAFSRVYLTQDKRQWKSMRIIFNFVYKKEHIHKRWSSEIGRFRSVENL